MNIQALHIAQEVRHPQYGLGVVKSIAEKTAEILFNEGLKTVDPAAAGLEPGEAQATVTALEMPLATLIRESVRGLISELGLETPDSSIHELGSRWQRGKIVLHPSDPNLQTKEVPLETFFHKVVMIRNNLRVLEQKVNSHPTLTDSEKVDFQQYITRSYGSMTTFNILFREREGQFNS